MYTVKINWTLIVNECFQTWEYNISSINNVKQYSETCL